MGKIEIYGSVGSPRTRTVMIICELIRIPYEVKIQSPMNKSPEFKKLNPAQQIPVLVDDGFVLPESHAILIYLLEKYAKNDLLYPKDLKSRAVVDARLNFDNGTFWPRVMSALMLIFMKRAKLTVEDLKPLNDAMAVTEEFLTRDKWVAGPQMTVADISISVTVFVLLYQYQIKIDMNKYPKTKKWLEEVNKLEAVKDFNEEGLAEFRIVLAEFEKAQSRNA